MADRVPRGYIVQLGTAILPIAGIGLANPDPQVRRLAAEATEQLAAALDGQVPEHRTGEEPVDLQAQSKEFESAQRELTPLLEAFGQQKAVLAKGLQDDDVQVRLRTQRTLESLGNIRLKLLRITAPAGSPEAGAPGSAAATGGQLLAVTNQVQRDLPPDSPRQMLQDASCPAPYVENAIFRTRAHKLLS